MALPAHSGCLGPEEGDRVDGRLQMAANDVALQYQFERDHLRTLTTLCEANDSQCTYHTRYISYEDIRGICYICKL